MAKVFHAVSSSIHKNPQELNSLERLEKTDKIKVYQKTHKRIETGKKGLEIITVKQLSNNFSFS